MSTEKEPNQPEEPNASDGGPQEFTLKDGESISISAPQDGTTHVTVNIAPSGRSQGFFTSCLQGCGCVVLILVVLAIIGSFVR
ncbi:MAG: hypothetical protein RLZZ40_180 [Actinomycetota bacterium]